MQSYDDNEIESKFRDTKAEARFVAFLLRTDSAVLELVSQECFTVKPLQFFYEIAARLRTTLTEQMLLDQIDRWVPDYEKNGLYKVYARKVFAADVSDLNRKNVALLAKKLVDMCESKIIIGKIRGVVGDLDSFDLERTKNTLRDASIVNLIRKKEDRGEYLEDFEERKKVQERKKEDGKRIGIKTGIRRLDAAIGGLQKSEWGIVMGGSGFGKSIALQNFATNAWLSERRNVAFVSIEMPKHQVQFRIDSMVTKILYNRFRSGELDQKHFDKWETTLKALREELTNFFEIVCLHRNCSANTVMDECERIQDERGAEIDLLIIDYLNIMVPCAAAKGGSTGRESQVEIAWDIKSLCRSFNNGGVALWTANQVTDEAMKGEKFNYTAMKYARGIAEVCPLILALVQTPEMRIENRAEIQVAKSRDTAIPKEPIDIFPNFDFMLLNTEDMRQTDLRGDGQ